MIKDYLNQIRIIQWIKNLIIFFPLLITLDFNKFNIELIKVFISFSFLCSFFYCINDYKDYKKDSIHPTKKNRPYASGKIKKQKLIFIIFGCLFLSLFFSFFIKKSEILIFFIFYAVLNFLYNFINIKIKFFDFLFLVSFYYLRLIIGSNVLNIELSQWINIIFIIIFFNLALLKRYYEIFKIKNKNSSFKNYKITDIKAFDKVLLFNLIIFVTINFVYIFSDNPKYLNLNLIEFCIMQALIIFIFKNIYINIKSKNSDKDFFELVLNIKQNYLLIFLILTLIISNNIQ